MSKSSEKRWATGTGIEAQGQGGSSDGGKPFGVAPVTTTDGSNGQPVSYPGPEGGGKPPSESK